MLLEEVSDLVGAALAVPRQAESVLAKLDRSELALQVPKVEEQLGRLELTIRRMMGAVLCAAGVLGAVQLEIAGHEVAAAWLAGAALAALLWTATRRA